VAGLQQRTRTLLAAHALVASFLGTAVLQEQGASALAWLALTALVSGLVVARILLAPWRLRFSLDVRGIYDELRTSGSPDAGVDGWLTRIGFAHQELQEANATRVRRMSALSGMLAFLAVCQTLAWIAALLVH